MNEEQKQQELKLFTLSNVETAYSIIKSQNKDYTLLDIITLAYLMGKTIIEGIESGRSSPFNEKPVLKGDKDLH